MALAGWARDHWLRCVLVALRWLGGGVLADVGWLALMMVGIVDEQSFKGEDPIGDSGWFRRMCSNVVP